VVGVGRNEETARKRRSPPRSHPHSTRTWVMSMPSAASATITGAAYVNELRVR
jgi:hypothetical protein